MSIECEILDYSFCKEDIEHWVLLKGEYRYESIIKFLKSKNIDCTWKNVTSYIKYDKRILINSFKYIVFLEEIYKSFIFKYTEDEKTNAMLFRQAYQKFLDLGDKAKYDGIDVFAMKKYQKAINIFRNCVVHNRVLLERKYNGLSLEEVLKIFIKILPQSYRTGYINDINLCQKGLTENDWHICF